MPLERRGEGIGYYGMNFPAMQTTMIHLANDQQRGTANSTFFTAFDLGVGAGMVLGGLIAQKSGLSPAFLIVAASALLGAVLLRMQKSFSPH